jgi:hypothetical protein
MYPDRYLYRQGEIQSGRPPQREGPTQTFEVHRQDNTEICVQAITETCNFDRLKKEANQAGL